jgi:DNA polymerase theta
MQAPRVSSPDSATLKSIDRALREAGALVSPPGDAPVSPRQLVQQYAAENERHVVAMDAEACTTIEALPFPAEVPPSGFRAASAMLADAGDADDDGDAGVDSDHDDELPVHLDDDDNVLPPPGTQSVLRPHGGDAAAFIAAVEAAAAAAATTATQGRPQFRMPMASRGSDAVSLEPVAGLSSPTRIATPYMASATQLAHWGLPASVLDVYRSRKISALLEWQAKALSLPGVVDGRSLVYSAPTSGGKSLVADILVVRRLRETGRGALIALPFVAMCEEKMTALKPLADALGVRLHKQYGSFGGPLPSRELGITVATYEKANRMVSQLAEAGRLHDLSIVVVDELHMLGDEDRGSAVEFLLTKVVYATSPNTVLGPAPSTAGDARAGGDPSLAAGASSQQPGHGIQIVGMSATLANGQDLARWLRAAFFHTSERPVPLRCFVKVGDVIEDAHGEQQGELLPGGPGAEDAHLLHLCQDTVNAGGSLLVFCGTKASCASTSRMLAEALHVPRGAPMDDEEGEEVGAPPVTAVEHLADNLQRVHDEAVTGAAVDNGVVAGGVQLTTSDLAACARRGVAWHHSGLSPEERELVELAFRGGVLRVIVCTSTLAAGVNLPARRVIIRHNWQGKEDCPLDAGTFLQMAGRAGRKGLDASGECIVFAPAPSARGKLPQERIARCRALLTCTPQPLSSALLHDITGDEKLQRLMMEAVTSGLVISEADMERYMRSTLLCALVEYSALTERCHKALTSLVNRRAITWDAGTAGWKALDWGKAAAASGLPTNVAQLVHQDLLRAATEGVITVIDLHVLFLAAPTDEPIHKDWLQRLWTRAIALMQSNNVEFRIFKRVGLDRDFIRYNGIAGRPPVAAKVERAAWDEKARLAARMWHALVMLDVLEEKSPVSVAEDWHIERGMLISIQERSQRMASAVAALADALGHAPLAKLLQHIHERIAAGTRKDIMALAVGCITPPTARLLYRAGLRSLDAIAALPTPGRLVELLIAASPRTGRSARKSAIFRAGHILQAARLAVQERAHALREQATEAERAIGGGTPQPPAVITLLAGSTEVQRELDGHSHLRGLVLITRVDSFLALCMRWDACSNYSFSVTWTPAAAAHSQGPGPRCRGIALALPDVATSACVFYIAFSDPSTGPLFHSECCQRLARCDGRGKFSVDVKEQIQALTSRVADPYALPAACASALGDAVLDIRIMAWLLFPDNKDLWQRDDSVSGGSVASSSPVSILACVSGSDINGGHESCASAVQAMVTWHSGSDAKSAPRPRPEAVRAATAAACARIAVPLWTPMLREAGLWTVLTQLEMPIVPVLASMERVGMPFDPAVLQSQVHAAETRLGELREAVRQLTGIPQLDVMSAQQVSHALFHTLSFTAPTVAATYTGAGARGGRKRGQVHISVNKEVLRDLAHSDPRAAPIVRALLEHRELSHRLALCESYLSCGHPFWGQRQLHRVHSAVYQTNAETGRLAMDRPSLHNVPHAMPFLCPGAPPGAPLAQLAPRLAFAAGPGKVLLVADFKQFELRMMAHFSGDEGLTQLLRQGEDPFMLLAAQWTGKAPELVSPQERKWAKALSYAMLYGKGYNTLAFDMEIPVAQAVQLVESFQASLPGVKAWKDAVPQLAKEEKPMPAVRTLSGRRRQLPGLLASDREERAKAERQAVNTLCQVRPLLFCFMRRPPGSKRACIISPLCLLHQGSAADVLKRALIALQTALAADSHRRALLVLSVHDDVVLEVDADALPWAATLVRSVLLDAGAAAGVAVPLDVELSFGPSWGQLSVLDENGLT